jgi:hypothetical protein
MNITHFKPQIEEIICDLFFQGYTPPELTSPFSNKMYWWQHRAYEKVSLHFDSAEMDVKGWLCAVEAITGNEETFNLSLIQCFTEAIEQQWKIRMSEGQAVLNFEQERELVSV